MNVNQNIFLNKKILIYGLGKTGVSTFKFLKKKNKIYLFDDNKNISSINKIKKIQFDIIILSPGIDKSKCKLKKLLQKKSKIIYTDLDVFKSFYKNKCITITGTNGKSTTCQLLYDILNEQGYDVKLAGNIGYPILSIKNIKPESLFVIEASSYQLDYSKIFKSEYSAILNIKPDHLERHKTFRKYVEAKFKLIKNQEPTSIIFLNKFDENISNFLEKNNFKNKIIKVNTRLSKKLISKFKNKYFSSLSNQENLSFVLKIIERFRINKKLLIKTISNFKGLKFRQQIIYNKNNIQIINDSKSTSYSSSLEMLKTSKNIYWLIGGIPKAGDRFKLPHIYHKNISGYIFGKNTKKFFYDLNKKIKIKRFPNLKNALNQIYKDIKIDHSNTKTILFSPAAASFDNFKNFEDRGQYFNKIIREYFNGK